MKKAAAQQISARQKNPLERVSLYMPLARRILMSRRPIQFDLNSITNSLADMEGEDDVPKIKLGDASCAAPFTSKLSRVASGVFLSVIDGALFDTLHSCSYHPSRAMHPGRNCSNVQDSRAQLSHLRICA